MAKQVKGKSGTTYIIEDDGGAHGRKREMMEFGQRSSKGSAYDRHEMIKRRAFRRSQERMDRFNRHYPYHWDLEMIAEERERKGYPTMIGARRHQLTIFAANQMERLGLIDVTWTPLKRPDREGEARLTDLGEESLALSNEALDRI